MMNNKLTHIFLALCIVQGRCKPSVEVNNDDKQKSIFAEEKARAELQDMEADVPNTNDLRDPQGILIDKKLNRYYAEHVDLVQRDVNKHWPLGIIQYYLDSSSYDYIVGQRVRAAMDLIESVSCVQFHPQILKPVASNGSWLHITNPKRERKCAHSTELKYNGEIVLVLGLDCLKRRDILHTLLHGIGGRDEITHPQRDQYVRVFWENIQPAYRHLFQMQNSEVNTKTIVEYDPMSIMHFHDRAFSVNGQATIATLIPGLQINPSDQLSQLDKMKLRLYFGHECNRRKVDDLLDTCKNILHEQLKQSGGLEEPSEDNPKGPFQQSSNKLSVKKDLSQTTSKKLSVKKDGAKFDEDDLKDPNQEGQANGQTEENATSVEEKTKADDQGSNQALDEPKHPLRHKKKSKGQIKRKQKQRPVYSIIE